MAGRVGTRERAWRTHIVCAPGGGEELSVLATRCGGGSPRAPREGVRGRTGQFALWGGGLTPRLCRGPPRVRVCWRGTPQASRFLACGKSGGSGYFRSAETREREETTHTPERQRAA